MSSSSPSPQFPRPLAEPVPGETPTGLIFALRKLVRASSRAALATTLAGEGRPYVSLVTVATDIDGSPLLLLSRLADHTRNVDGDTHVSLLFDGTEGYANPQQGPRVSLLGRIEHSKDPGVRRRFLARHPGAALYADFADFAFYRVPLERAHWVGGFARAVWLDQGLACDHSLSRDFAEAEAEILNHMNADHADTVALLANRLLKRRGKGWKMVAVDPDGCDLTRGSAVFRLAFAQPLEAVAEARRALSELADQARGTV